MNWWQWGAVIGGSTLAGLLAGMRAWSKGYTAGFDAGRQAEMSLERWLRWATLEAQNQGKSGHKRRGTN